MNSIVLNVLFNFYKEMITTVQEVDRDCKKRKETDRNRNREWDRKRESWKDEEKWESEN